MTKALRKAIMRRSNLQTLYFKQKTPTALKNYKKQKNYCSRLYKKERKKYYSELNLSDIYRFIRFPQVSINYLQNNISKSKIKTDIVQRLQKI